MKLLKSRTVWTFVALFLINGVAGIHDSIPAAWLPYVDGVVGLLGIWFKMNPSQTY